MCLGEIGQLVELRPVGRALVRTPDRTVEISLVTLADPVRAGDWVLAHSGFALERLSPAEAAEALALRATAPAVVPDSAPDGDADAAPTAYPTSAPAALRPLMEGSA